MNRGPAGRVLVIFGGLVLLGIVLKLLEAILAPVLPAALTDFLSAGLAMLYGMISPAVPAIAAVTIVGAFIWIVMALWRRY
jgi:hypothetical protein